MAINSIGSSVLPQFAINGLSQATYRIQDSTVRLSTNSRFARASDDVAGQSIATKFSYALSAQRMALQNASQATSLLQVAYGGLQNISDILTAMKSTATQANSGSLSASERLNLDTQFQQYVQQIDSIASGTNFNGVKLLDGSVNEENKVNGNTNSATRATASLNFSANPGVGQTVVLNGVSLVAGTDFAIGASTNITVSNLANTLQSSTNNNLNMNTYQAVGNVLNITAKAGGALGNQFVLNQAGSTSAFTTVGGPTVTANVFTTQGGANNGLYFTGVNVSGTIGDTLVNTQSQVSATQALTFTGNPTAGNTISIDNGNGGLVAFTFVAAPAAATDIQIGATQRDSIANAVAVINRYSANNDFGVRQIEATRSGSNVLNLTYKAAGNPNLVAAGTFDLAETVPGTLSGALMNNGVNTGVNADGVTNAAFVGTISGFSATYNSADNVTAQVTVGSETYSATITDTTPAANTNVRFSSTNGGYFDVQFASAGGQAVTNQTDANTFSARLNAAFSGLNFYQTRQVTNYTAAGQLTGSSLEVTLSDFSNTTVNDIQVTGSAGAGLDATVDVTINGETFRNQAGLGSNIGDFETIRLFSLTDGNRFITFRNGNSTIDLSNQTNADTFETNLKNAVGFGTGGGSLQVQIGETPNDKIGVRIPSVSSSSLFNGVAYDLSTQANAANASTALDTAINTVTSVTADVGAYQARFDYTASNLTNSIAYTDEARAAIADTDIPFEATRLALAQVQAQSAIAVLAQVNSLSAGMLDLLRTGRS